MLIPPHAQSAALGDNGADVGRGLMDISIPLQIGERVTEENCKGAKCVIYAISEAIDYAGVAIIAVGAALGILLFLRDIAQPHEPRKVAYDRLRTFLGRSLLLGLEFLVAGDIIKTVAIDQTITSVLVLAIVVIVRTILSLSIDVEIDGHWPWDASRLRAQEVVLPEGRGEQGSSPHNE